MKAFLNDPAVKDTYLRRVADHAKADEIIKGKYWENGKGCAVGCTIHSSDHSQYQVELGIPTWLAKVEDVIFEGLQNGRAKAWPSDFLSAISVGANLETVQAPFVIFVLESNLANFDHASFPDVKAAVEGAIAVWKRYPNGPAARSAAESAARSAAYTKFADKILELLRECK